MTEWMNRRPVPNDANGCFSIHVHGHKTESGGSSVLTLTKMDMNVMNNYITKIRPVLTKDSSGYVFPNMQRPTEPIRCMKFGWFNARCEDLGLCFRWLRESDSFVIKSLFPLGFRKFKPHDVRHFFSTDWHEQDIPNAARLMDHHPKTAETYYAKLGSAKSKAVLSTRLRRFGENDLDSEPVPDEELDQAVAKLDREIKEKGANRRAQKR